MQTRTLFVLIAMLTIVAVGSAQEDWNITGAGARAEGLGGAFIGLADDATAISWNPSGLGQLERVEFSAVGRWIGEEYMYSNPLAPSTNSTISQSHFTYNFASIAFPLHAGAINIVPAVAFQKQLDSYGLTDTPTDSYESNGGANTITPGIGIKLHPMIYVGGTVNIWLGNFDNTSVVKSSKDGSNNDGTYSGTNFTAGLLVDFEGMKKPIPIKLGATIKTPFDLKYDGNYQWKRAGNVYQKGAFVNTVQFPLMYGFGASGRIGENLTLAVDFESRLYGDRQLFRTTDGKPIDTLQLSDSKSNLNQVRFGAEYLIVTSAGVIPLRGGFRTIPTLRGNRDIKGEYPDQVSGTGFTAGTGFISNSFALDVTYSRSTWEQTFALTGGSASYTYTSQVVSASLIVYF